MAVAAILNLIYRS